MAPYLSFTFSGEYRGGYPDRVKLVDEIAIIGTAAECRERLRWTAETGIHTHIIAPVSADPAEIRRTFEAFTPENYRR